MSKNSEQLNYNFDFSVFKIDEKRMIEDPIKQHIDKLAEKAINIKYKDEEMIALQTIIKELNNNLNRERNKITLLKQRLVHNINKIDEKLKNIKEPNDYATDYRKIRLKAIKTKCKEILRWLDE